MGEFSLPHILVVLIIVLVFFGPSRLPGLGKSLGEAIRGFKQGMDGANNDNTASSPRPPSTAQTTVQSTAQQSHPHASLNNSEPQSTTSTATVSKSETDKNRQS